MAFLLQLSLSLSLLALLSAQTPVPAHPLGFSFQGNSASSVVIEAFYDHLCPDSRDNWPVLKKVFEKYSNKNVAGILHIFPLPFHHNAYFMQQAGVVVRDVGPPEKFVSYLEMIFDNQDKFSTGAVNFTEPQVQMAIADFIQKNIGVNKEKVMQGFTDAGVTVAARYAWKYGASRSVTGAPQFLVNGVHVPDAPDYTSQDWDKLLDSLLSSR